MANAQPSRDARVADLVRSGHVRVALFLPQYTTDPVTGEVHAAPVFGDIARTLADRIGVETLLTGYQNPREVVKCLKAGECDLAFMVPDNSRIDDVGFSPPVLRSDFTCLVPAGTSIRNISDADSPGVRIAAVRNHVSTLTLSRILKQAELITAETSILIVDDNECLREILSLMLSSFGYEISQASNGSEAVKTAASIKPDLILMDMDLPDMKGQK